MRSQGERRVQRALGNQPSRFNTGYGTRSSERRNSVSVIGHRPARIDQVVHGAQQAVEPHVDHLKLDIGVCPKTICRDQDGLAWCVVLLIGFNGGRHGCFLLKLLQTEPVNLEASRTASHNANAMVVGLAKFVLMQQRRGQPSFGGSNHASFFPTASCSRANRQELPTPKTRNTVPAEILLAYSPNGYRWGRAAASRRASRERWAGNRTTAHVDVRRSCGKRLADAS